MNWFATIKRFYEAGYYSGDPTSAMYIGYFVKVGKISETEFKEITGSDYVPPVETA
jgi:uncharacterized XkdX family phage protein